MYSMYRYGKAFDGIKWDKIFYVLKSVRIDYTGRRVIWNLYRNDIAVIGGRRNQEQVEILT